MLDKSSGRWIRERELSASPTILCIVNEALADFTLAKSNGGGGGGILTATPHRVVLAHVAPRFSVVYEMRTPSIEVWESLEQWSRVKRDARRAEAKTRRRKQQQRPAVDRDSGSRDEVK